MGLLFKAVLCLLTIGVVGLLGFAVFSDLPAPRRQVVVPVEVK